MAAGLKLINLDPVSLTGGIASQLYSNTLPVYHVLIVAEPSNVGYVYIGDSNTSNLRGIPIEPGNTLTISVETDKHAEIDISDIYALTNTSGNIIRVSCLRRRA